MAGSSGDVLRGRERVVSGVWLAAILSLGCASAAGPAPEAGGIEDARSPRDTLMFGPASRTSAAYRASWAMTIGVVTAPVWLPWLTYEAFTSVVRDGELYFAMLVSEGRVLLGPRDRAGVAAKPPFVAVPSDVDFGRYQALVIGNDDYRQLKKLVTAGRDAEAVSSLLREAYGFETILLRNATRAEIVYQLHSLREELGSGDNLLIYYAGHGQLDEEADEGYWLPIDAAEDDPTNWLANSTISTMLKAIRAKHILLVVDSCFSGTLTRSGSRHRRADYLASLVSKRARVVMTSGGLEPVADSGSHGHSVFANYLLQALSENPGVMDGSSVFTRIRISVMENAHQTPEYGTIRFTGHDGGDFLFVRRADAPPD